MATTRAIRLLIAAGVAVGVVAVAGLIAGLKVVAGTSPPIRATTSSTTPVTVVNTVSASPNTVTVVGSGQVNAAPDEAPLSLGLTATRPTAQGALNAAAAEMTHLIAALRTHGVAAQDMQTSSVSLSQNTNCCPAQITGYSGSSSVTVTIHHLTNVGAIEVAAVAAVGNDIQLNGVSLILSDDSSQLQVARVAAIADARSRAGQWQRRRAESSGRSSLSPRSSIVSRVARPATADVGEAEMAACPSRRGRTSCPSTSPSSSNSSNYRSAPSRCYCRKWL